MSTADPELRRVSVHAGTAVADLSLPAAVPVATLIPSIVDILGHRTDLVDATCHLACPGEAALDASTTLAQNGIRDGAVLVLSRGSTEPPAVRHDDVAEAVAATLEAATTTPRRDATRLTGALAANCLTIVGALVLIRNTLGTNITRYSGATAGVAAASSLVALLIAALAHRAYRDPIAGLTLSFLATLCAAVAGLFAVPGAPGVPNALLAAISAAVTAVLAARITGCGIVTLTAISCAATVVAVATLVGTITAAPWRAVGSLAALASLGLLEVSARMSIVLARLSPRLPPATDFDDTEPLPAADELAARAIRADQWLTSLLAAFASSAAVGAISTVLASHGSGAPHFDGVALAVVTSALLLLRARSDIDTRRTLVFAVSGMATVTATFATVAAAEPQRGPLIVAAMAIMAAAVVYLSFVAPARPLSPVAHRCIDLLELLGLVAMVPLTCWTCGVFGAVRGLNLTSV